MQEYNITVYVAISYPCMALQAYLSRACFYGMKGQYTKAILNCNEAIRLRPTSVRAYLYRFVS